MRVPTASPVFFSDTAEPDVITAGRQSSNS